MGKKLRIAICTILTVLLTGMTTVLCVDITVTEIVSPKYDEVTFFSEGLAAVMLDGKWGYIDKTGAEIIPLTYDGADYFSEGLAAIKVGEKWGYINKDNAIVISPQYDIASGFDKELARVCIGSWGADEWYDINKEGERILSWNNFDRVFGYVSADRLPNGLIKVRQNRKYGCVDENKKVAIPIIYRSIYDFSEGVAPVEIGEAPNVRCAFIDETGTEVVTLDSKYIGIDSFSEGLARVQTADGKYGYVDKSGKEIVSPKYDFARQFIDGLALVCIGEWREDPFGRRDLVNGRYGFINHAGEEVIPLKYVYADRQSEGLIGVDDNGLAWGFIDYNGNEIIPGQYTNIGQFSNGLAAVTIRGKSKSDLKMGFIDKMGNLVVPFGVYDFVKSFENDVAAVGIGNYPNYKWGFIQKKLTAYASSQSVLVNDTPINFQMYALKDENGNPTNYVKLRDVASVLNGTPAQFDVSWDGTVNILNGQAYTPNGSEMTTPFSGNRSYTSATAPTKVNGKEITIDAIVLEDDQGGAYTYYKLRDLGRALGFKVDWSTEKGIFVETE